MLAAPRDRPWGIYSGYFQDPDGHLWEVLHNPARRMSCYRWARSRWSRLITSTAGIRMKHRTISQDP